MSHWANNYIGIPWQAGGQSIDGFDCWGLVRHCQLQHFDVPLPTVDVNALNRSNVITAFKSAVKGTDWGIVEGNFKEGDCILLSGNTDPVHVGILIDVDNEIGVLHSIQGAGVVYTKLNDLQVSGWRTRKVYRWNK